MKKKKQHYLLPCKGQKNYWGEGRGVDISWIHTLVEVTLELFIPQ